VLWGAGRNGKDMAKRLLTFESNFHWMCNNKRKIGKEIYEVQLESVDKILALDDPQIMVVVASQKEKTTIRQQLSNWGKLPVSDFWFFI